MWYLDGRRWNENYSPQLDSLFADPALFQTALSFPPDRSLVECRVHGNPHLDTANIGWHESTATKRAEAAVYDTDAPAIDVSALANWVLDATAFTESIYLIDADDGELTTLGESGMHERLTSHFAEPVSAPEPAEWTESIAQYTDRMLVEAMARGSVPSALPQEIFLQRLGMGGEWIGASLD